MDMDTHVCTYYIWMSSHKPIQTDAFLRQLTSMHMLSKLSLELQIYLNCMHTSPCYISNHTYIYLCACCQSTVFIQIKILLLGLQIFLLNIGLYSFPREMMS